VSRRGSRALFAVALLLLAPTAARAQYPERVLALFCEADGRGERLHPVRSQALGGFLGWRFEPAWDRFFLISGYEVRPESIGAEEAQFEVRYTVTAEISGEGAREESRIEGVHLTLLRDPSGWRLLGAPPPPHLFASDFEADKLFTQLTPVQPDYLSNSKFVWRMLLDAGWSYPYQPTSEYLGSPYFKPVGEPSTGDVVAYLVHGVPYHIGIYLGDDRVASATVRGVVRTPLNAFPGEVRYLRLTEAARAKTPEPAEMQETPAATPLPE
jgi:hypothetical protein